MTVLNEVHDCTRPYPHVYRLNGRAQVQPDPDYKALVELAAKVLLQHMNDEDYEYSLAGLYAKLTEHEV